MTELVIRVQHEIEQLHAFFEGWLSGVLPQDRAVFSRLESALAAEFRMVVPSGEELGREQLLRSLWEAHARSEGLLIRIENCRIHWSDGEGTCLACYEEVHHGTGDSRRVSTALFQSSGPDAVLSWVYVHETWSPGT